MKSLLNSLACVCALALICGCGGSSTISGTGKTKIATIFGTDSAGTTSVNSISVFSDGSIANVSTTPVANGSFANSITVAPSAGLIFVGSRIQSVITGSISVFKFSPDGTLTPTVTLSNISQPLSLSTTTAGDLLLVNNDGTGLTIYAVNTSTGALTPLNPPGGITIEGPAAISPDGRFIFASDGGDFNSYSLDRNTGAVTLITSVLDALFGRQFTQVLIDPSGKFVYTPFGANGGSATPGGINGFAVAADGSLTQLPGSPFAPTISFQPSVGINFAGGAVIDGTGTHLYAGGGSAVYAFGLDQSTGVLTPIAGAFPFSNAQPLALTVEPSGKFLLVSSLNNMFSYSIGANGAPTLLPTAPFRTAPDLTSMVSVP